MAQCGIMLFTVTTEGSLHYWITREKYGCCWSLSLFLPLAFLLYPFFVCRIVTSKKNQNCWSWCIPFLCFVSFYFPWKKKPFRFKTQSLVNLKEEFIRCTAALSLFLVSRVILLKCKSEHRFWLLLLFAGSVVSDWAAFPTLQNI